MILSNSSVRREGEIGESKCALFRILVLSEWGNLQPVVALYFTARSILTGSSTKTAAGELYTKTWNQCRHFVLPMNPQRTELEYAIKNTLTQLGVGVRIGRKKGKLKTEN